MVVQYLKDEGIQSMIHEIQPIFDFEAPLPEPKDVEFYQELIPLILSISRKSRKIIAGHNAQLAFFKGQTTKCRNLQRNINHELQKWSEKMRKLGFTPTAIWKVQVETTEGLYQWEFPSGVMEKATGSEVEQ